jgi:4-aminobutyrate aminotransferase
MGDLALARLQEMEAQHRCLGNTRGRGLMIAVDIVMGKNKEMQHPELRGRILREAFSRGLLLLPCGETSLRITPPLCINETQIDVGLRVLDEVLATLGK